MRSSFLEFHVVVSIEAAAGLAGPGWRRPVTEGGVIGIGTDWIGLDWID